MAKPYSMDLRERVVAAVERDGMSRSAAAERYGVAISTAVKWVRRSRTTGSVSPGQMGGTGRRFSRSTAPTSTRSNKSSPNSNT